MILTLPELNFDLSVVEQPAIVSGGVLILIETLDDRQRPGPQALTKSGAMIILERLEKIESSGEKRITLEDLAQAAGISRSAASKAMRDHPRISEGTRLKVQALAVEMGYKRDPALSRLAKYRWSSRDPGGGEPVAFLYPYEKSHDHDPTFRNACERVAIANGFVFHAVFAGDYPPQRLCKILHARGIRGVIIQRIVDADLIHALIEAGFACVAVDEGEIPAPCELIRTDYLWCIPNLVQRHHDEGRTNLALLLRHGMRKTTLAKRLEAVWHYEKQPANSIIYYNVHHPEELPDQLMRLMPEGIVSFLWTRLPESYLEKIHSPPPKQYALRLFRYELENAGGGYYLSEERIARRAMHYLESHLFQAGQDKLYGTTLMRPEWIDPK